MGMGWGWGLGLGLGRECGVVWCGACGFEILVVLCVRPCPPIPYSVSRSKLLSCLRVVCGAYLMITEM